jgi:hypothetical protein
MEGENVKIFSQLIEKKGLCKKICTCANTWGRIQKQWRSRT